MKSLDYFYCVDCGRLVRRNEARQVFNTGFYRIDYPLGQCVSCSDSAHSEPNPAADEEALTEDFAELSCASILGKMPSAFPELADGH